MVSRRSLPRGVPALERAAWWDHADRLRSCNAQSAVEVWIGKTERFSKSVSPARKNAAGTGISMGIRCPAPFSAPFSRRMDRMER